MSNYHYVRSEPGLWTVGTGQPGKGGDWEPESDHASPEAAAARVAFLNGGTIYPADLQARIASLEADNAALREALEMIADKDYTWMPQIKEIARAALLSQDSKCEVCGRTDDNHLLDVRHTKAAQQSAQSDGACWACDECNHYPNLSNACENCGTPRR